jgi:hypothetical protein
MDPRRRLRLMLALLIASLAGSAGFTWLINPFGRWRVQVVGRQYRSADPTSCTQFQRARISVPYRVRDERPTLLLVGSSRVQCGIAVDRDAGDGVLNAALPGASVPEIAALLEVAAANPALRQVIWAADFFAFGGAYLAFADPDLPRRLRGETRWSDAATTWRREVWDLDAYRESWRVLGRLVRDRPHLPPANPAPWPPDALRREVGAGVGLAQSSDPGSDIEVAVAVYRHQQPPTTAGAAMHAAIAGLRQRGVEVTVVILPMSACELQVIRTLGLWDAFLAWKRDLVAAAGPYWDFSGDAAIAGDESLFSDVMHLKTSTGHVVLRRLLGLSCEDCGPVAQRVAASGVWVDARNIDAHLAAQRPERLPLAGRCAEQVPALLAAHGLAP